MAPELIEALSKSELQYNQYDLSEAATEQPGAGPPIVVLALISLLIIAVVGCAPSLQGGAFIFKALASLLIIVATQGSLES